MGLLSGSLQGTVLGWGPLKLLLLEGEWTPGFIDGTQEIATSLQSKDDITDTADPHQHWKRG